MNAPIFIAVIVGLMCTACGSRERSGSAQNAPSGPTIQAVDLNDPVHVQTLPSPLSIGAARNEWIGLPVRVSGAAQASRFSVRLNFQAPESLKSLRPEFSVYEILPMPIDTNRAGYVRHTGQSAAATRMLPRALLPIAVDDGRVDLGKLRSPSNNILMWLDVHIPADLPPGDYRATCELYEGRSRVSVVPIAFTIYDFELPQERHLQVISRLDWDSLTRLFPADFEAVTPRLLNRKDPRYAGAVKTMDQLVALAQANRTAVVIPRLQPTVKWPSAQPPQVDWTDFDGIVTPWLDGKAFADGVPLGYWPLPSVDFLDRFDVASRQQYWRAAATHFDQLDWLPRSAVSMDSHSPGRAGAAESLLLSAEAQEILASHPRIRVNVPLEDDQIQFASNASPQMIDPTSTSRLVSAGPGLVSNAQLRNWPDGLVRPQRWLRTDLPGLLPYVGAGGDERDVRLWAWLAFLRDAKMILFAGTLPPQTLPTEVSDPNDLIWFYPGEWFGVDEPVPTLQLKWLRRAQQDYEYLWMAEQRGEKLNTLLIARLMTKPVEISPGQSLDPTTALLSGTTDTQAWTDVQRLLAQTILLRKPGQELDLRQQQQVNLQTLRWLEPRERPLLFGRSVRWLWDTMSQTPQNHWVDARIGFDIYNASDSTPDQNTVQFTALPPGWQVNPQPVPIAPVATYHVRRATLDAKFNLDRVSPMARRPIELTFINGYTKRTSTIKMVIPVAMCSRREGKLTIDGNLLDWNPAETIQDGPLVQFLDRPMLQSQNLRMAGTNSTVYSGWADQNLYFAFRLNGLASGDVKSARNFVDYQFRRAWGEDLCEILIQPIYADNATGPLLHIVCKPTSQWIERQVNPKENVDPWQPFEGSGIRYASTIDGQQWNGELAIPWSALMDAKHGMPRLLRFNFVQHRHATGESASWAGPVDFGRDDTFMGLIHLRENDSPGMK